MSRFRLARISLSIEARGEVFQFVEDLELKSVPIGFPDSESERNIANEEKFLALKVLV